MSEIAAKLTTAPNNYASAKKNVKFSYRIKKSDMGVLFKSYRNLNSYRKFFFPVGNSKYPTRKLFFRWKQFFRKLFFKLRIIPDR